MIIDESQIVKHIEEAGDLSAGEIEQELEKLKKALQKLKEGEKLELKGLGIFQNKKNRLLFETDDVFASELNYKYAGMVPIEIVKPNRKARKQDKMPPLSPSDTDEKEPEETASTESPPEEISSTDEKKQTNQNAELAGKDHSVKNDEQKKKELEESAETEKKKPKADKPVEESKKGKEELETEPIKEKDDKPRDEKPEQSTPAEISGETEPVSPEKDQKPIRKSETKKQRETIKNTDENDKKSKTEKVTAQSGKSENGKTEPGKKKERKVFNPQDKAKKDSIFSLVNTLIAIVILGGIIYLVYRFDDIKERRNRIKTEQQATQKIERDAPVAQSDEDEETPEATEAVTDNGDEPAENQTDEQNPGNALTDETANNPEATPEYGLKGTLFPQLNNGYTIVVHSFRNKAAALFQQNELMEDKFRTLLMPRNLGDADTTWRVGIGQFENIRQAKDAAETLEDRFGENYFIKRISF